MDELWSCINDLIGHGKPPEPVNLALHNEGIEHPGIAVELDRNRTKLVQLQKIVLRMAKLIEKLSIAKES